MLKQRIITALILIPAVLIALFVLPPLWFLMLTAGCTLFAAWEWSYLIGVQSKPCRTLYLLIMLMGLFNILFIPIQFILLFAVLWWIAASILVMLYSKGQLNWQKSMILKGLMGLFVLIPAWAAINFMRNQPDGAYIVLFLFLLIWGADITAYFGGKKWGKHPLALAVSPGKSWEGLLAALGFTVVFVWMTLWFVKLPIETWLFGFVLSIITVLFSVMGDLFESMLKRMGNMKDSGQILPGHGGILDRIDSLSAAAPIFAFGTILIGTYLS